YEGPKGEAIAPQGPYLVSLPKASSFLAKLVKEGWGNSWGLFLTSAAPFADVRKHFRHFLEVRLPDNKVVLFRFYDPRVLRIFLPTCTREETAEFFGPIRSFLMEANVPDLLLRFTPEARGARQESVPTAVPAPIPVD